MVEAVLPNASYDEHGWHLGVLEAWPWREGYAVLAPETSSVFALERWDHQARRFFGATLAATPTKRYDSGWPRFDSGRLEVGAREGEAARSVCIQTLPSDRAAAVLEQARAGVVAMGGAGFDVLVGRTKRVWQFQGSADDASSTASLLAATIVASVLLGPILAPDGSIFGVKTARERLAARALSGRPTTR